MTLITAIPTLLGALELRTLLALALLYLGAALVTLAAGYALARVWARWEGVAK